jgi:hypothetical protein
MASFRTASRKTNSLEGRLLEESLCPKRLVSGIRCSYTFKSKDKEKENEQQLQ